MVPFNVEGNGGIPGGAHLPTVVRVKHLQNILFGKHTRYSVNCQNTLSNNPSSLNLPYLNGLKVLNLSIKLLSN